jgi:superfamily I DNA and/or RNA helicase
VRTGRPVKVRESLREATLDAQLEQHPKQDEIAIIREETDEVQRALSKLKGREKGLAHRDIQYNRKEIRRLEKEMIASVLDNAQVICSTNIGTGHRVLDHRRFPIVLMDEATQAIEPSSMVPISKGCRQLILVGDHRQLPPTVISNDAQEGGLGRSLFERLIDVGIKSHMLTVQYRMHPVLREFPSARFYEDKLEDGCSAEERPAPAGVLWPDWDHPFAFIPITGSEIEEEEGGSRSNPAEAARIYGLVQELLVPGDITPGQIGIITPYSGQVRALCDIFDSNKEREQGQRYAGLEINSVDGYQGREKEVIIFSAVRSNPDGIVGFLSDRRRLNVAITRAKRGLIVLGDPQTLRFDPTWRSWLDWADERGLFAWHLVND